ncbi:MAG: hypothetical protein AB7L84_13000 [Acidimicrobiia bacterium]
MAVRAELRGSALHVGLTGWDRAMAWQRSVEVDRAQVVQASVERRGAVEPAVDHRVRGIGPHDGAGRPGRRRVGTMLGRAVPGPQFWAVPASGPDLPVLVLDLSGHALARVVLSLDDPDATAAALRT